MSNLIRVNIVEAEENQSNLLNNIAEINETSRPRLKEAKNKKINANESAYVLYEGQELTLNTFKSVIFPMQLTQGKWPKIFTPKKMLQKLPIALAN